MKNSKSLYLKKHLHLSWGILAFAPIAIAAIVLSKVNYSDASSRPTVVTNENMTIAHSLDELSSEEREMRKYEGEVTDSAYDLQRLMVFPRSGHPSSSYGAVWATYYEPRDYYVFQYDSEEATENAYNELVNELGSKSIVIDSMMVETDEIDTDADYATVGAEDLTTGLKSWGHDQTMLYEFASITDYYDSLGTVKVAVIDSGCNQTHEALADFTFYDEYDFFNNDSDASDDHHHGTYVASLIADTVPSDHVQFAAYKALSADGGGSATAVYNSIERAIAHGADIINMSLSITYSTSTSDYEARAAAYDEILQSAVNHGILVFAASANKGIEFDNPSTGSLVYPAASPYAIAVGSYGNYLYSSPSKTPLWQRNGYDFYTPYYSDFGSTLEFAGPGEQTVGAWIEDLNHNGLEDDYKENNGTSAATPHVAAAATMLKLYNPSASRDELLDIMRNYATDIGPNGRDKYFGWGYINFIASDEIISESEIGQAYDASYTLSFDTDGGSNIPAITVHGYQIVDLSAYVPEKNNKEFGGWYVDSSYSQQISSIQVTRNTTVYAKWNNLHYTVSFNTNGGSSIASQSVEDGQVAVRPSDPEKGGSTFVNWYSDPALTTVYNFATPVTGDITLYAKWSAITYTVSFNMNGGPSVPSQTVEHGQNVTRPSDPVWEGHNFIGWYADADLNIMYNFAAPVANNTTIYAKWTIKSYTVSFNTNGGPTIPAQTINHGGTVARPSNPEKEGFDFAGWYSDASLSTSYNFLNTVTSDMTLYAKWNEKTFTVSFNSNGGTAIAPLTVSYNRTATRPSDPLREGHTFVGWFTNEGLTIEYDFTTPVTSDVALYAKWDINTYTVTFNTLGGSSVASQTINYEATATRPSAPTLGGFTFVDWYLNEALTTLYNFSTPVTGDITLYAKWVENEPTEYMITAGDNQTYSITSGDSLTIAISGDLIKFESLTLIHENGDVYEVDPEDYELAEGSTIITISAEYLDTLPAGTYEIYAAYNDGFATGTLTIEEEEVPLVPKTGENSNRSDIAIVSLSIAAVTMVLVSSVIFRRRHAKVVVLEESEDKKFGL